MTFDPFSWAIGFALTKSVGAAASALASQSLEDKLGDAVLAWAKNLPPHAWVEHTALLTDIVPDSELSGRPALAELRTQIRTRAVPTAKHWETALFEHWNKKRIAIGKDAQPFFLLSPEEAEGHIRSLAVAARDICADHEPLFKGTVLSRLDQLLATGLRPAMGLREPLVGQFQARDVARAVEAETGSHIHAVILSHDEKKLWMWGRFFGRSLRDQRWILASAARLVSAYAEVESLFLGYSLAAELPGTDAQGAAGLLLVEMTRTKLDILAKTHDIPADFWDDLRAYVCTPEQVPFERWDAIRFREIEETLA